MALLAKGVSSAVMHLPQVHDTVKQRLVTYLVAVARQKGVSAYVGDGQSCWAAGMFSMSLYRLALEKHEPGVRYHAAAGGLIDLD